MANLTLVSLVFVSGKGATSATTSTTKIKSSTFTGRLQILTYQAQDYPYLGQYISHTNNTI